MAELILRTDDGEEHVLNSDVDERVIQALVEIPILEQAFGDVSPNPATGFWMCHDGRSNSSELANYLHQVVFELLSSGCGGIPSKGWRSSTAGMIVAQLAYVHGMAPLMPRDEERAAR